MNEILLSVAAEQLRYQNATITVKRANNLFRGAYNIKEKRFSKLFHRLYLSKGDLHLLNMYTNIVTVFFF